MKKLLDAGANRLHKPLASQWVTIQQAYALTFQTYDEKHSEEFKKKREQEEKERLQKLEEEKRKQEEEKRKQEEKKRLQRLEEERVREQELKALLKARQDKLLAEKIRQGNVYIILQIVLEILSPLCSR
jgi:hypothetical protein